MTRRFVLSREAGRDLEEIETYTAQNWGDDQAEQYLREIFDAFDALTQNPSLGRRRDDVPAPYLVHAVGSHLIVYRLGIDLDRIEVLNLLHPAMNVRARLD